MVDSDAKIKWVQAGRRAGKTRSSLMEAMNVIQKAATTPVTLGDSEKKLTAKNSDKIKEENCQAYKIYKSLCNC